MLNCYKLHMLQSLRWKRDKLLRKIVAKQAKTHYYKTDPLFHLIGEANETEVFLNGT